MTKTTSLSPTKPRSLLQRVQPQVGPRTRRILRGLAFTLGVVLILALILAFYWSREPIAFELSTYAPTVPEATTPPAGYHMTAAAIGIASTLLNKPGGYLTNDVLPPSSLLDNMPSWEMGVLTDLRDTVRALRDDFGRAQSQSREDIDLRLADAQFHFPADSWMLPSSEEEYTRGIEALQRYQARLIDDNPQDGLFFARADNLIAYLEVVEKRLGSLTQRLSANVPSQYFSAEALLEEDLAQLAGDELNEPTSWWDIDNVFYESRGYVWALMHMLKGVERDFEQLLESKNARVPLRRIIAKLENTQNPVWSPLILSNSGFGLFTNHSLVMASYISRANAALIDLRLLLMQG